MNNNEKTDQVADTGKLKRNESRFSMEDIAEFIENASVPLHSTDGNGIILWANQAELDYLGYSEEEYVGKSIFQFHADLEVITDILKRLHNDEILHNVRARLVCKDGTIKHVLLNSNVLRRNGEFIHTRCFTRDFNEIIKEEDRKATLLLDLAENEARLRMAIESTGLGTWDYEPVTGKLTWSAECRKIYGAEPDEAISFEKFAEHIHPEDKMFAVSEIEKALDPLGKGIYDIIYRIIRFNDNAPRWIRAQGKVYFDSSHTPIRFIGTVVDITEIKLADIKSARLAAIVESSDDPIVSKTLDGIITTWNQAAERTFGYSAEEMIGASILKLIPVDRHEEEAKILALLRKGERVEHYETKRITKDNLLLDVSLTISPIRNAEGKIIGSSKIARDITDKKKEEQRRNDFLAMVSHELKTPLTTLHSYTQMLLGKAKKEQDSFSVMALTKMESQTKRMNTMIVDFLNLGRLEEGKLPLIKEVFDLHVLLEEVIEDSRALGTAHTLQLNDAGSVLVNADRNKISQVILNLISNAIKYSAGDSIVEITSVLKESEVTISVKDSGIGISSRDQKRLFERFYRVENEKIKNVSGFGIGLYLVSEILRSHESQIEVESEEGVGSVFYFSLNIY